jgi:CheY-like chemotaxis protein
VQKPIHILLVEDDPDDVDLLESALRDNQVFFESHVLAQGNEVLPYLNMCKNFPEIILLDLNLPKMHGREVLTLLKQSPTLADIPVVILTTSSAQADKEYCLKTGAADYLIKPVTMEDFKLIVDKILGAIQK